MKLLLSLLGAAALGLTVIPPCLRYAGVDLSDERMKWLMLLGAALWFATATPRANLAARRSRD